MPLNVSCATGDVLDPCGCDSDAVAVSIGALPQCTVRCNDIDSELCAVTHADATSSQYWDTIKHPDWIVGSPPYHYAAEIARQAIKTAKVGIALKLRLTFLEPCASRADIMLDSPPTQLIVLPRVTAYNKRKGVSSHDWVTEAWFIWLKESTAAGAIAAVSREELDNFHDAP